MFTYGLLNYPCAYHCAYCHPKMCSTSFNVDHSQASPTDLLLFPSPSDHTVSCTYMFQSDTSRTSSVIAIVAVL